MAYDEGLAERIRVVLGPREGLTERKMFGGLAFLDRGNMCVGVTHDELMVRIGKEGLAVVLAEPGARPMQMQGRDTGMVFVAPAAIATDEVLAAWVARGLAVSSALPPKG
jgi:TfoX/Sxy family transcriptional regulator of competence genes